MNKHYPDIFRTTSPRREQTKDIRHPVDNFRSEPAPCDCIALNKLSAGHAIPQARKLIKPPKIMIPLQDHAIDIALVFYASKFLADFLFF